MFIIIATSSIVISYFIVYTLHYKSGLLKWIMAVNYLLMSRDRNDIRFFILMNSKVCILGGLFMQPAKTALPVWQFNEKVLTAKQEQ